MDSGRPLIDTHLSRKALASVELARAKKQAAAEKPPKG